MRRGGGLARWVMGVSFSRGPEFGRWASRVSCQFVCSFGELQVVMRMTRRDMWRFHMSWAVFCSNVDTRVQHDINYTPPGARQLQLGGARLV